MRGTVRQYPCHGHQDANATGGKLTAIAGLARVLPQSRRAFKAARGGSEHDPEKWAPVFGKDHAHQSTSSVSVVEALDVVLAEIAADLHLDQLERDFSRIGEAMDAADRDIDRLVLVHGADDDPVLGAMEMLLQREPRAR